MKFRYKSDLIILLPTAIFLLLFSGLYLFYDFYISSYFSLTPYEWYAFSNNTKPPSTLDIVFSGFKDLLNLLSCLSLAYLSVLLSKALRNNLAIKSGFGNTLATSASLTLSSGLFYFIYLFLRFIFINGYTSKFAFDEIASQISLFALLYLLMIIPFVNSSKKHDFSKN